MKLYYAKGACSLAIRITLNKIGVKFTSEAVDLKTKITETEKNYLEINPKGAVPALELDNGEILTENSVIHQYLADKFNATDLLPIMDNLNRYRVLEWLNYIATDLHKTCSPLFNPNMPENAREIFTKLLLNKLRFVDQQLKNKSYLLGDQFSVADSYLFVILFWLPKFKIDLSQFVELSRYFHHLEKNPAVIKSLTEEGFS